MPRRYTINFPRLDGGTNLARGVKRPAGDAESNNTTENVDAMNMRYVPEGGARTSLGYGRVSAWSTAVAKSIDGLHPSFNYPDVVLKVVNGVMYIMDGELGTPYNVDNGLSLAQGVPVFMREYRGQVYFTNGVNPVGRIAIGQLLNAESGGSASVSPSSSISPSPSPSA